jgi:hypothetical protein
VQSFATGTSGTDFAISSATATHTFNLPTASAANRGALSSTDWSTFNNKFTLPALTSGSVLFSNGTTIAQDNSNLFWDDTNNRLGIGTNAPANTLDVNGTARVSGVVTIGDTGGSAYDFQIRKSTSVIARIRSTNSSDSAIYEVQNNLTTGVSLTARGSTASVLGFIQPNEAALYANIPINIATSGSPISLGIGSTRSIYITTTNNVLVGTTTDSGFRLDVNGTARINTLTIGLGLGQVATNTVIGVSAGGSNTTGSANFFGGYNAGFNNLGGARNTAVGNLALYSNQTGNNNNAFGDFSFASLNTGSNNAAYGQFSGRWIANGSTALTNTNNSVFIGVDSRANANSETNQIVIGYQAIGAGSNTATLGNTSIVDTILRGRINLQQYATGSRPTYVKGALIYDSTLGKLVVGGNAGWEVVTSS